MEMNFSTVNWFAILACVIIGQIFLTIWFVVIFGTPWAKEYGVENKQQHAKEIPGYTYAVQIFSTALLIIGIALLQNTLEIDSVDDGLLLGICIAIFFAITTALPGYAFLKRWNAFLMAMGSQIILILIVSIILAVWS